MHNAAPATQLAIPPATPPALRRAADLPTPRGLPLFGNLLQVDAPRMHQQMEQWAQEHGPYYWLRLGRQKLLVIGNHADVATLLRDRPDGFGRTPRLQQLWVEMGLQPGVFGANGETWKLQRRMVMAGFAPAQIRRYHPSLQRVAGRLAARWSLAARTGAVIELQADLMRYTVDTIAGLAFGADVNTLQSDGDVIQQHLDQIFPALYRRLFAVAPFWRWLRSPADRRLDRSVAEVKLAVAAFIAQARQHLAELPELRDKPDNLLQAMIVAADSEGSGISDAAVAGNVLTMLLAGEDTTANSLAWMIELLWRHPAALARASDEVRRVIDSGAAPSFEQLAQLDYIEACAHETMRLKPVAPLIGLQALRDSVVGDVLVPAGTVLVTLMRRDSVSDAQLLRAAEFMPERWLADAGGAPGAESSGSANAARRVSMPFGAGPRICPGRYLALLEMKMLMAVLLSRFDILDVAAPGGAPAREKLSFTMMPVGLTMRLRERSPGAA